MLKFKMPSLKELRRRREHDEALDHGFKDADSYHRDQARREQAVRQYFGLDEDVAIPKCLLDMDIPVDHPTDIPVEKTRHGTPVSEGHLTVPDLCEFPEDPDKDRKKDSVGDLYEF